MISSFANTSGGKRLSDCSSASRNALRTDTCLSEAGKTVFPKAKIVHCNWGSVNILNKQNPNSNLGNVSIKRKRVSMQFWKIRTHYHKITWKIIVYDISE